MSKGKDVHPVYTMIATFVRKIVETNKAWTAAIDKACDSITTECDVFVRSRNYTDWTRDALAANSARIEPLVEGGRAFTYSTMQGRRIDDIIFCVLDDLSKFVYEPVRQKNDKLNSQTRERDRWKISLGYTLQNVTDGKGKRVYGDARWQSLRDSLEELIPERFEGTKQNKTALQMIGLVAPPRLQSTKTSINVYRPNHKEEGKNLYSLGVIKAFLADGYNFDIPKDAEQPANETAAYYFRLIQNAAAPEQPKKAKKARKPRTDVQAPVTVSEAPPAPTTETVVEEPQEQIAV